MPHVTFDEEPTIRRSYDDSGALTKAPRDSSWDRDGEDAIAVTRRRSRTLNYKYSEDDKQCKPVEPDDRAWLERKITYKDGYGNIIKIIYEDWWGKVVRTVYPKRPPPPPPKDECQSVSEPSNVPSEDVRDCSWTKIVVRNSRGVVWKIVHVDCYGKTMKTEYPEIEPRRRRHSSESRRTHIKEHDHSDAVATRRRRCSDTRKYVVAHDARVYEVKNDCEEKASASKETDLTVTRKSSNESHGKHSRHDSVTDSSRNSSGDSSSEDVVVKDSSGVTRRVTYTDSRGRRRTVVYDED